MTASRPPTRRLFVALGDSFTEGVGDPHPLLPNGVRGWADRVADRLARAEPGWRYANLAVRSKRLDQIVADQLDPALALAPTLVTVYAGGNDLMDAGLDLPDLLRRYEDFVRRLAATGATLVLFTGYEIPLQPALRLFRGRNRVYNETVRRLADELGAVLVDYWSFDEFADRRMWASDRLHLSKAGHRALAVRVLNTLEVPHDLRPKSRAPSPTLSLRDWGRIRSSWVREWILPLIARKLRGVTLGDDTTPRWPDPVEVPPKGGLRRWQAATSDTFTPR